MLLKEPLFYYEIVLSKYPASYLAEDNEQVIIGIDCEYFDSLNRDFSDLKSYFLIKAGENIDNQPSFAGLFGVIGWESIHFFENVDKSELKKYDFPAYCFSQAAAYLHYDKASKIYSFYGDEKYYELLLSHDIGFDTKKEELVFDFLTDINLEKNEFIQMVNKAKEYIKSGDIFQVVLSSQLHLRSNLSSLEFYKLLSKANPSPYMFCYPTPYGTVVGSSPELIFSQKKRSLFVAPIAGTAPRGDSPNDDERIKNELLSDPKELAEHKMLIDLARNDIGRVAKPKSVVVKNAMQVKFYERVMHIESDVFGELSDGLDGFDAIASIFPAGTLSGTPKIRAMQIISELESCKRGIYGGGIGFLHFNLDVQLAILIRSALFVSNDKFNDIYIGAGAGIVYDSLAEKEYAEINHKRASLVGIFQKVCKQEKI